MSQNMSRKKTEIGKKGPRTRGEEIFDLVTSWVELDSPKGIEDAVSEWTGRKNKRLEVQATLAKPRP